MAPNVGVAEGGNVPTGVDVGGADVAEGVTVLLGVAVPVGAAVAGGVEVRLAVAVDVLLAVAVGVAFGV